LNESKKPPGDPIEVTVVRSRKLCFPLYSSPSPFRRRHVVGHVVALAGQRARVFDLAVGGGAQDTAGTELLAEFRVLRVVRMLRLLLGVEVVEIAEELVEATWETGTAR
jgi:hypothetical protein